MLRNRKKEVKARSGRKLNSLLQVCAKLFWYAIYCANPRSHPDYQTGPLSCRVLGRQDPRIIREYDLETVITILLLTQPHMCEIGSVIFAAMS